MQKPSDFAFKGDHAANYDKNWQKLTPFKTSLHLAMELVLTDVAEGAEILCVGAGTGAELLALAQAFPAWRFMVVEPSGDMLVQCINAAKKHGIEHRCRFHEGYLHELEGGARYDAATSILVSQFLLNSEDRRAFYSGIASRLKPGGLLISADLSAVKGADGYGPLFDVWANMMTYAGAQTPDRERILESFGRDVAVLPQQEIEALIASAGFAAPSLFHKTLFINATFATLSRQ
jgi:tRNA (cmo5U34)-methyltransferase